jgi:hypothetical protein
MSVDEALKYVVSMGVVVPSAPPQLPLKDRHERSVLPAEVSLCPCVLTYCGLVTEALLGQAVTLCGWVNRRRDHGGVIFVDLRDREGYVQVVCDPDRAETFKTAENLRNEFCVQIKGLVRARPAGTTNDQPQERQDRGAVPRAEGAQPLGHAAVPARRREPVGDHAPDAPRAGPAPAVHAEAT